MDKIQIGFSYPKNVVENSKSSIYSNNLPNYYIESQSFYTKDGKKITQTINESKDKFIKTTTVQKYDKNHSYDFSKKFRSIQTIEKDNTFRLTRTIDDIIVNGHEFKPYEKLYTNKYAKSIKGFIQKMAWKIANDKNGCERKIFRNISGKIINKIR